MPALSVQLVVADRTLRYALTYVLEQAGHVVRSRAGLVVADRLGAAGLAVVHALVIDPVPAACQWAVSAITRGQARAAVCSDDLEQLPPLLANAAAGTVSFPERVVLEANRVPPLESRLLATLQLLLAGHSNVAIGRQLHASESTVKRDIAALLKHFDVPNRNLLAAVARRSGYDHRSPAVLASA